MIEEDVLEIEFDGLTDLQRKIVHNATRSNHKYIVVCAGRQGVGKTTADMVSATIWALENENWKIGFFMPTYKQCKKVLLAWESNFKDLNLKYNKGELKIQFDNGSVIELFTSENDNCRGFTFDAIIVDEACFIKNDIWTAAILPTVSRAMSKGHGKALISSTPKTKNWFFDMCNIEDSSKIFFKATSEEGGLLNAEVLKTIRKFTPEHIYRNEYLAEFLGSGEGILSYVGCTFDASLISSKSKDHCSAGIDWGISEDSTVLTIQNFLGEVIFIKKWVQQDWMDIIKEIASHLKRFKARAFAETNGIGDMPFKELRKLHPDTHGWYTSSKSKTDIINKLAADFKSNLILIPDYDFLLTELDAFSLEYNPSTGKVSYGARQGMHDDCVMSLAIANFNRLSGLYPLSTKRIIR